MNCEGADCYRTGNTSSVVHWLSYCYLGRCKKRDLKVYLGANAYSACPNFQLTRSKNGTFCWFDIWQDNTDCQDFQLTRCWSALKVPIWCLLAKCESTCSWIYVLVLANMRIFQCNPWWLVNALKVDVTVVEYYFDYWLSYWYIFVLISCIIKKNIVNSAVLRYSKSQEP